MSEYQKTDVLDEIIDERCKQELKWGEQNHDPFKYLAILGEEVGEANQAALESFNFQTAEWRHKSQMPGGRKESLEDYRKELIQVAAVAVAMVECLDRNKWEKENGR